MRVLLRVLAPLLGLALAAAAVLLAIEVVAAWVRSPVERGLLVPWPDWRTSLTQLTWADQAVRGIGVGVAVVGLLLVLIGLLARRSRLVLDGPVPSMTVTTTPRVVARLIGRRVRAAEDVAGATVTVGRRRVGVVAEGWGTAGPDLRSSVRAQVTDVLDQVPLHRRPRVAVSVHDRRGPR